jgi:serine/threonine-protein kinase
MTPAPRHDDRVLEVQLFELLERRGGVRLGRLVQLRRQARADRVLLLDAAVASGAIDLDVGEEIAERAGVPWQHAGAEDLSQTAELEPVQIRTGQVADDPSQTAPGFRDDQTETDVGLLPPASSAFGESGEVTEPRFGPPPIIPASPARPEPPSAESELPTVGRWYHFEEDPLDTAAGAFPAHDQRLDRTVSLRCLPPTEDDTTRARRVAAARLSGRLEHPVIPPVYELGRLDDGRVFVSTRTPRGRTLEALLRSGPSPQWTPRRLFAAFGLICQGIGYAHARGAAHGALGESRLLLGDHGEVTVDGWGLLAHEDGPQAIAADLHGLGAILRELVEHARRLSEPARPPRPEAPLDALAALADRCNPGAAHPLPGAEALGLAVEAWLDSTSEPAYGAADPDAALDQLRAASEGWQAHHDDARNRARNAARLAGAIGPGTSLEAIADQRAESTAAARSGAEAERRLVDALLAGVAVFSLDRQHPPARAALADLAGRALEAAADGQAGGLDEDPVAIARLSQLVEAFDDEGTWRTRLVGDGRLRVDASDRSMSVTIATLGLEGDVLRPGPARRIDRLPADLDPIPMGRYLLRFSGAGIRERRVAVRVARAGAAEVSLRAIADEVVGEAFVHVPGGPAILGGDAQAFRSRGRQTVDVQDFLMARAPVTCAEYAAFLQALARTAGAPAAAARAPRRRPGGEPLWPANAQGAPILPVEGTDGGRWAPGWPVTGVSCEDAEAWCKWRTARTGQLHRLPSEQEWEKAARGGDGRVFPWGDRWAPGLCHTMESFEGGAHPGPPGAFEADRSVHGVVDLAGLVSEWTSSWLDGEGALRIVKGGHWDSGPTECRAASRFARPVRAVRPTLGFRVVREAPRS